MAPSPITEDYYMVLDVEQAATPELITQAYKRLAFKLHPDRNAKHNATEEFQRLGRAYETLKDEGKRRAYNLIYPFIKRSHASAYNTQTPHAPPQTESPSEAAQIAALQKSKRERAAQWRTKKNVFDSSMFELQRGIRRLEHEIKNLDSILAAEAATEARKNGWTTWFLSPIYKKVEDSEEEKARKDRGRQERRIEKDMKERRLESKKVDLKTQESLLRKGQKEFDAAELGDDSKIGAIHAGIRNRENRERQEREKAEQERLAKIYRQQQEQREEMLRKLQADRRAAEQKRHEEEIKRREAAEALRKQQAEKREAEQKRRDETERLWQYTHTNSTTRNTRHTYTLNCRHDGWWPKVQGRTACPECNEVWTYLLRCPGCEMKACPKCQATIRPRQNRGVPRAFDYDWYR